MLAPHTRGGPANWVGQTLRGKYKIVRQLGEGGWGAVFEAEHLLLRRTVAIKLLHPDIAANPKFVERFRREALAASRIGHPNIVEVIDLDRTDDGTEFMVLEFLRGEVLENRLERQGPLRIATALDIFEPIASALQAAHRSGIVHRDLKPANVFLAERPDGSVLVKVLDFGIAKMDGITSELTTSITQTGAVLGTPFYMPPEQLRGDKTIDLRADLYAFGVMLYEVLAAAPPFDAPNLPALVTKIMYEAPVPLAARRPKVPPEIDALVSRLMSKNAADRPADFGEVIPVLESVRAKLASGAVDDTGDEDDDDEETLVQASASMDEMLEDLPTMIMQSPLAPADATAQTLREAPSIRIDPEIERSPRAQSQVRERPSGTRESVAGAKIAPKPSSPARSALPHEATDVIKASPGRFHMSDVGQTVLIALAFVAVVALTYWIVLHL